MSYEKYLEAIGHDPDRETWGCPPELWGIPPYGTGLPKVPVPAWCVPAHLRANANLIPVGDGLVRVEYR